jgi:hypothetical protein
MKTKFCLILFLFFQFLIGYSQSPQDVYKKPLKEVLTDIEKRYNIKLQYSKSLVKGVDVMYPTWRYRMDTEETLTNILMPLDMIFQKTGDKVYQIGKYAYHIKPVEEGRKHLEKLLASYPDQQYRCAMLARMESGSRLMQLKEQNQSGRF